MCWHRTMSAAQPRPVRRRVLPPGSGGADQCPGLANCMPSASAVRTAKRRAKRGDGVVVREVASPDLVTARCCAPPDSRRTLGRPSRVGLFPDRPQPARCHATTDPIDHCGCSVHRQDDADEFADRSGRENVTRPMQFDIFMRIERRVAAESSGQRPPPPPDCHSSRRTALIVRMDAF